MGLFRKSKSWDEIKLEKQIDAELLKESIDLLTPEELFPVTVNLKWSGDRLLAILDMKYSESRNVELKQLIKKKKQFVENELKKNKGFSSIFEQHSKKKIPYKLEVIESEIKNQIIDSNSLKFSIEPITKHNTSKLISGGNFDFGDDFSAGYSLTISQKNQEKGLMKHIVKNLRHEGWACLYGDLTTHCHINEEYPTEDSAKEILNKVVAKFYEPLKDKGMPILLDN